MVDVQGRTKNRIDSIESMAAENIFNSRSC